MKIETFAFEGAAPCAEPVVIAELLNEIEAVIHKHVVLRPEAAAALAVWVLHTYTFELRDAVAYVAIESPEKRCGKTTLLSVLAAMAHKPLIASNITLSALFRAIDACRPTLFIDEADTFLAGNGAMRGIINSGNTWRTAYVLRLARGKHQRGPARTPVSTPSASPEQVPNIPETKTFGAFPQNLESGLKRYSSWCPKVIALIGEVPDTIADRSIVVKMTRKLTTENRAPLSELNVAAIRSKCARFALDSAEAMKACEKIRGKGLNDRAADTYDPLFVIARLAGGDWEKKLEVAAAMLSEEAAKENSGVELLLDILSIFMQTGREKIFCRELAGTLQAGLGGMRTLALRNSAIDEYGLAKILRQYEIRPSVIRLGKEVNRGYKQEDFYESLRRFVPKDQIEARLEELERRQKLGEEAKKEAQEEIKKVENIEHRTPNIQHRV